MSALFKKRNLTIFTSIFISLFFCLSVFASVCTYDIDGNGTIDPATEYWTCIGEAGQLCPYNTADCTEAPITMSGSASIGATNISDKNGVTQIQAGTAAGKLDFYGWQCVDNSCVSIYMGGIDFTGTSINGAVSVQKITRLVGNSDKIEVYGCSGNGCTEESLQGSITISGSTITGTVQSSEGLLSVEASGNDLIFTGMECSYGYCQETPAGFFTIEGSTFSVCPHGSQHTCYYNSNSGKYQCSTIECGDGTLGGSIGEGSKICAKDIDGDGIVNFSPGTQEVYECQNVEGGLYCAIEAVACEQDTQEPICPEGATFNPDTDKCEATPGISCPSGGYVYVSDVDTCAMDVSCPDGGSLNPNSDLCEIVVTSDLCPAGYTYNGDIDSCTKEATCAGNGTYSSVTDRCELPPDHDCPDGYDYNPGSGMCEVTPVCTNGTYNASTDRCEQGASTVCASGYTYNSSLGVCVTLATCPAGSSLNASRDECEAAYGYDCPTGYTYNSSLGVCQKTPVCSSGSYNTFENRCEQNASAVCTTGYTYDSSLGVCKVSASCPAGSSLNASRDKCETAYGHNCPSGYSYNSSLGVCQKTPVCSSGSYNISTNRCEQNANAVCASGYTYDSSLGVCKVSASCPTGSSLNASRDKCETIYGHSCPSGYSYNSSLNVCQKTPPCPNGGRYNTSRDRCEIDNSWSCSTGTLSGSICYVSATCSGGSLNTSRDKCEVAYFPTCASGYTYNSSRDKCEASPVCPSGSSYNTTYNVCLKAASSTTCPSGYTYNSSRQQCEKTPACPSGSSYNTSTNRCERTVQWYCSFNGNTYSNQSTCNSNCSQTGTCTESQNCVTAHCYILTTGGFEVIGTTGNCSMGGSSWPQCPNNTAPAGGNATGSIVCWIYQPTNCGTCYGYPDCTTNYTCSLTGSSYSSLSTCQSNCSQGTSCTSTCPSGYTKTGSLCIANAICTSGGTLNASVDKCQYVPTYNCDSGYTYDAAIGYCKKNATCNSSGTLNTSVDKCQLSYSHSCPSGYAYNFTYSVCQKTPVCSSGTYNTSTNRCEQNAGAVCTTGYTYDGATGMCKVGVTCGGGGSLNTSRNKCEVAYTPTCASGFAYNATYGVCQKSPSCPTGGSYNTLRDQCEVDNTWNCPTGTLSGSICYVPATCSYGSLNGSTDKCEVAYTPTCASGFAYNATYGVCQKAPACPTGGSYNTLRDQCEVDNTWSCPTGMSLTGSTCYEAVYCPGGGNLNGNTELCEADSTFTCFASGYSYDGSANKCISDPVCDYGYYDGSIDLCRLSASGICPETYTYNSDQNKCLLGPPCLTGAAYSITLNQCSISAIYDCPDTSEYSPSTRLCWAYPMCPGDMPYNEEINGCDGGYRTCPYGVVYPCLPEPETGIKKCSPNECFEPIAAVVGTDVETDTTSYQNDGERDPETGVCEGEVYIFNGRGGTCKPSGMQTMFFNCCDTSEGSFLMVKKACGEEAGRTVQAIQAGRCHYVGEYCAKKWKFIGCVQRAKTYCCFNSKLGRIIQEQGREQLQNFQPGGNWGSAESPNCIGFTPEQFSMIDFSRVDLGEFIGDIQGQMKTNIEEGVENKISDYYNNY